MYWRMGGAPPIIAWEAGYFTFEVAEEKARALIKTDGIKTENGMAFPLGYAIVTGPGWLKSPLNGIIHVNIWSDDRNQIAYDSKAIELSVIGALKAADQEKLKSVAFPALGSEANLSGIAVSLQESLISIMSGIENYFEGKASTQIEKVAVMIDAQPTFENAIKMLDALNDILRK
jgi:O-acetyl-ADP-ribose deacetylase (regulator of RNase III)